MKNRKPKLPATFATSQQGVVLLEALIAMLIFSMGILAVVGMQAAMIKNTTDSKFRSEASFIAQKRLGDMWANPTNLGGFVETNTDISNLLPSGTRTVVLNSATQVTVTVTWAQPGQSGTHNYQTTARIAGG
ncbi:type IV pilus modification protein PilV [Sulfurirhabdus autotrophica]|uniref:Type IV pilus assembly protein PilV n=1 Tax=Sulfurirhabdus autotrophica TaxID=1706046 RepID=A0A4R3YDP3_9PROT|nr:type IV pilus modification protein PilV [Sulfurirhabdus autotrophica]TCV88954.1 type IV pilus assembly protein PilV [Sulfurirhabdus autotrophica]